MDTDSRYSEFRPMQELGATIVALGQEGPTRRSRWIVAIAGILAVGAVAVSPVGAAIADAVDELIGGEPTTESILLGDFPGERQPEGKLRRYFDQVSSSQSVLAEGTTPLGTGYELILNPNLEGITSGGPIASCIYLGFAGADTGWRTTESCIGPTVSEGFARAGGVPIYPTIYRGPAEDSDIPTPIVIGVAPAEVARVEVTYLDESGERTVAPSSSAAVTSEMLSPAPGDDEKADWPRGVRSPERPTYATDPYLAFAAFLPPELDRSGPKARQPRVDLDQIEITAFDSADNELYSMHMDGRFSGDPGIASVG